MPRAQTESFFKIGLLTNKFLLGMAGAVALAQLAAIYLPFMNRFIYTLPLPITDLIIAIVVSSTVFLKPGGILAVHVSSRYVDLLPVVSGAARAVKEMNVEVIITGLRPDLMAELKKHGLHDSTIQLVEAVEVVKDGENAIIAAMRKPNSSMAVATKLVKDGKADAVVSAGSSGAFMVNAYQHLGCLPRIERPIIGGPFLKLAPNTFMLDMGANVGCQASDLLKFAVAGSVFVRKFHGIENPTVGLLNVGSEEGKGNEVVKEAYGLLKESGLNFIGNVEGMDIPDGKANVIVCDGFIGNILLKYTEGMARGLNRFLSQELGSKTCPAIKNGLRVADNF